MSKAEKDQSCKSKPVTITIECDELHLAALRDACETYLRIGLGQFNVVADQHVDRRSEETGQSWYDISREVEKACKQILMPEMPLNGSYGVGNKKVGMKAHLCYELWKLLGGGTAGPPLNYTNLPLPVVTVNRR